MLIFGANSLATYALFAWLPTRLTEADMSQSTAGLMLAVFGGMGVPAALVVPHLVARYQNVVLLTVQFVVCFAIGLIGLLVRPTQLTLLWVIVAGWGSGAFPLALTLVGLRSRTPAGAGRLSGFAQGWGYLVAGVGPIAAGVLRQATGGWTAPFVFIVAVLGLIVLGGVLAAPSRTVEDELEGHERAATGPAPTGWPLAVTPAELSAAIRACLQAAVDAGDLAVAVPAEIRRATPPARARRLVDQCRAAGGQAGGPAAARGRHGARGPARRGPGIKSVDVAGPGSSTSSSTPPRPARSPAPSSRRARPTGGPTRAPATG